MSQRYKGGVISATPPTLVAGAGASGTWTLEQQMQATAAGLWPVNGPFYIEDVFSTYLYTGNGSTQTITNGIDLAGKGGLVWCKARSSATNNALTDSTMNIAGYQCLISNATNALAGNGDINAFNANGFSLGFYAGSGNANGTTYASWTFRKQPKFFDVVTYTGDGTSNRQIPHSLGSVPGAMIVKTVSTTGYWWVYHRSLANTEYLELNGTYAKATSANMWASTTPTDTYFTVSAGTNLNNTSGTTYVAYLFAHNAGGFGLTGTDNVISCGSYYNSGSAPVNVNLGYEPQWILIKNADSAQNWFLMDTMRGDSLTSQAILKPNTSDAETVNAGAPGYPAPTATGFTTYLGAAGTFIYIAIRRGPMKVPTSGTSVFAPTNVAQASAPYAYSGFPVDMAFRSYTPGGLGTRIMDRLRGASAGTQKELNTTSSAAETDTVSDFSFTYNTGISATSFSNNVFWMLRRAPSFFDEVCWTGTGSGSQAITHNLGVAPEFTITKRRSGTGNWSCFPVMFGVNTGIYLDSTAALQTNAALHPTLPTATTYYTNDASWGDENIGGTFVTYLFATCAGVSKVGSYTGTGTTKQIDCGFTGGARFVLIKRTDSTGDWYVWDSARGIVAGNDPYLLLNSTAAEVTNTDYVDTYSAGFEISSTAPTAINASGGTFIFLAIA